MRSLLKELKDNNEVHIFVDYTTGSPKDRSLQDHTPSLSNSVLNRTGLVPSLTDKISYGSSGTLANITSFSIVVIGKFKKSITSGYYRFCSKRSGAFGVDFDAYLDDININLYTGGAVMRYAVPNTFNSLAIVYDDNVDAKFYTNGSYLGLYAAPSLKPQTLGPLTIGGSDIASDTFKDYQIEKLLIVNRVLTATEVAQLTSELEASSPEQAVSSKAVEHLDGYQFNGTDIYGDLATPLDFRSDEDWSLEYIWKCGSLETQALLSTTATYMLLLASGNSFYFYIDVTTNGSSFSSAFEIGKLYEIKAVYSKDTKIVTITRYNITDGLQETITVDLTSVGVWNESIDILGKYTAGGLYFLNGSIYDLKVTINGTEYNRILQNVTMLTPLPDYYLDPIVHFKGEMHALANERTQTEYNLENTPLLINSGSFKINTETYDGREIREIECVSTGSLKLVGEALPLTGWSRYYNSGSGYVEVTTDLTVANTISMSTGDKLIYASENPKHSLYNKES